MRPLLRPHLLLSVALGLLGSTALAAPPTAKKDKAEKAESVPPPPEAPPKTPATSERVAEGTKKEGSAGVVKTEEGKEGVKTYQFGAVEVEGRLRSPQLIYFLRRVRAEFVAGELGHRSFLRELESTRRAAAFR